MQVATFQCLWAVFRPTATLHTLVLGLHLAALNPRTLVRMRDISLVSFFALPVPALLFVTFHRMWLVTGNGNANYLFFQCLAHGMFTVILTLDFVSATVKRDKVRRMVAKGTTKVPRVREGDGTGSMRQEAPDEGRDRAVAREEADAGDCDTHEEKKEDAEGTHGGRENGVDERAGSNEGVKKAGEVGCPVAAGCHAERNEEGTDQTSEAEPAPIVVFL